MVACFLIIFELFAMNFMKFVGNLSMGIFQSLDLKHALPEKNCACLCLDHLTFCLLFLPKFKGLEISGRPPTMPPWARTSLSEYSYLSFTHRVCWLLGIPALWQGLWLNFPFCMGPIISLVPTLGLLCLWPWAPGIGRYHQGNTGLGAGLPFLVLCFLIPFLIHFSLFFFFCQSNNLKYFYILSLKTCFNILSITSSILYQEDFFTHPVQHIVRCESPTIFLRKYVTRPEVLHRAGNFYISSWSGMFYKPTFSLSRPVSSCLFRVSLEKFLLYLS